MNDFKATTMVNSKYKPVKARFYIIFTFSFFTFISGFLWGSWQPIMRSFKQLYDWNLTAINLLMFMPTIIFCIFFIPFAFLWNKSGFRLVYHLSVCFFLFGTFIRLYPGSLYVQSLLIQIGTLITSFGSIMAITGAPVISSIWFPGNERSRATGIAISFNTLGGAFSPYIGSVMVPDKSAKNSTTSMADIENGLRKFLFLQSGLIVSCILLILVYCPEKPTNLPCRSSDESLRMDFWPGFHSLFRNKQFIIVFIVNFITFGVNSGVGGVFTSFILPLGVSQKEAGLMSAVCSILTFLAAIVGGYLGDYYRYKNIIIITTLPSIVLYILLGLQNMKILPYDSLSIYLLNTILSFVTNIVCPISFEMGCEAAFPVNEKVTTVVLGFASNLGTSLFLLVTMIPNIGTNWIAFSYAALLMLLLPLMGLYDNKSKRKDCDLNVEPEQVIDNFLNESLEYSSNCPLLVDD